VAGLALVALTLVGFGLRLLLLDRFPLREDEALYASWALTSLHEDPLLLHVWPDKPPLFFWLLAGIFALTGPDAAAARWLDIAAATATIPVVAVGARRLWGSPVAGLAAGALLALNPFAVSFAATVYTDPLLVLFGALAIVQALHGRPGWAGVWLGAAVMTKQQGVLYIPLVAALVWLHAGDRAARMRRLGRWLAGIAVVSLPVLAWDSLRWAVAPSPWDLATRNYHPLGLAPVAEWAARAQAWAEIAWYLAASNAVWLLAGAALLAAACLRPWRVPHRSAARLIVAWGIAYLAVHVLTTVPVWDRYLLPLAPIWAWLLAWPVAVAVTPSPVAVSAPAARRMLQTGLPLLLLLGSLTLVEPAQRAAHGAFPIGGDHGDYAGLNQALAWLETQPAPVALYHQALGWHYRFYLYDRVAAGDVTLRWFPSAVYLADHAAKSPYPRRFLIAPDWAQPPGLAFHLATRGLTLQTRLRAGRVAVYEIVHPPQPACAWCWSGPRLRQHPAAPATPAWTSQP
jgi:4-amino-4-deoxy-L-arabinose transferase-like glycosyltransferase